MSAPRWLRRWFGIEAVERRVETLEGHRPEGDWWKTDDPSRKADEAAKRLRGTVPDLLAPGPAAHMWSDYPDGPKDRTPAPDLRRRTGPYL
jgi:hypothetical protein